MIARSVRILTRTEFFADHRRGPKATQQAHRNSRIGFLVGKVLISPASLLILLPVIWLGVVGWLFIQDNAGRNLQDASGITWFAVKTGVVGLGTLLVAGVLTCVERMRRV